jgi:hypothetical protein
MIIIICSWLRHLRGRRCKSSCANRKPVQALIRIFFFQTVETGDGHDLNLTAKATVDSSLRSCGDIDRSVAIV